MAADEPEQTLPIVGPASVGDSHATSAEFTLLSELSDATAHTANGAAPAKPRRRFPERIGPYRIEHELGRGGMGIVYLAVQDGLNREVALKVLATSLHSDPEELVRFHNEAESLAALKHPNIVQVYEVGEDRQHNYLAMEYVEGGTLATRIDGTPQPPADAARIIEVLARAVHFAHEKGIIHRDLKPANVLISGSVAESADTIRIGANGTPPTIHNSQCGNPKITDFGLARRLDSDQRLTNSGVAVGTPSYMAPEQAKGQNDRIGPATDIYALGVLLYEMLTGRPPFKGSNAISTMEQVCHQEPVSPRQLQHKVPRDLETICLRCLRKEPEKRYPTAETLANDLRRFIEDRPILARPSPFYERIGKWARRNPSQARLVAGLVIVFLCGVVGVLQQWLRAEGEWQRAEDRARDAHSARLDAELNFQLAQEAKDEADEARRLAEEVEADLALNQGLSLCDQGLIGRGLLWFVRALELAERAKAVHLERAIRINLADWGQQFVRERVILQQTWAIRTVAFHPKSSLLAVGGHDGRIVLHDVGAKAADRELFSLDLKDLANGGTQLRYLSWNAEGTALLSGHIWGGARLWDVANRTTRHKLVNALRNDVWSTAISADGKTCFTSCGDGRIRVWATESGTMIGEPIVAQRTSGYLFIALSPDGNTIVSAGADPQLRWWNWREGKEIAGPIVRAASLVEMMTWSPDGKKLLIGTRDGALHVWDTTSKRLIDLTPQGSSVVTIAYSPDGRFFVTGTRGGDVRLWDSLSLLPITRIVRTDAAISSVAFHADGRMLAVGDDSGAVRICAIPAPKAQGAPFHINHPLGGETHTVAFAANGDRLLTASTLRSIVWDWRTHQRLGMVEDPTKTLTAAIDPDGRQITTGAYFSKLVVQEIGARSPTLITSDHLAGDIPVVLVSPDGKMLFAAGTRSGITTRGVACLWDRTDLKKPPRRLMANLSSPIRCAAYGPDGRMLLVGCSDRTALFWDMEEDRALGASLQHASVVVATAISGDGTMALTGCRDGTARLWDVRTRTLLIEPLRMQGEVRAVAFSPDGRLLLTGSLDGTARFWDPKSGRPLGPAMRHPDGVRSVAFHPDGNLVATGCMDRNTQLWSVPPSPRNQLVADLRLWVEALTGFVLDAKGAAVPIGEAELKARRAKTGLAE